MADDRGVRAAQAVRLYRRLLGARIRADFQYRTSFALYTVSQSMTVLMDLASIYVIFGHAVDLVGWTRDEVLFLSAVAMLSFGLGDMFVSPVERVSAHVKGGTFDRFLLRPVGPLLQICTEEFALRRIGRLIGPAVLLAAMAGRVGIDWTPARALAVAGIVATGTCIYSAFWLIPSSVAFWVVDVQDAANLVTYGGVFIAQYPLDVLSPLLRRLVVLVPIGFVSYLPCAWLLGKGPVLGMPAWSPLLAPAVAALFCGAAAALWRSGVRHYRSTGT